MFKTGCIVLNPSAREVFFQSTLTGATVRLLYSYNMLVGASAVTFDGDFRIAVGFKFSPTSARHLSAWSASGGLGGPLRFLDDAESVNVHAETYLTEFFSDLNSK